MSLKRGYNVEQHSRLTGKLNEMEKHKLWDAIRLTLKGSINRGFLYRNLYNIPEFLGRAILIGAIG